MRKHTLDNRKVVAPNASFLAGGRGSVKRGDCFIYNEGSGHARLARSLGRIASCEWVGPGEDCTGYICAMALSDDATHGYVRWVNPADVAKVFDAPSKMAAFFFAPELPYSSETLIRLMDYGTVCERFIGGAGERVDAWDRERRQRAAAKAG